MGLEVVQADSSVAEILGLEARRQTQRSPRVVDVRDKEPLLEGFRPRPQSGLAHPFTEPITVFRKAALVILPPAARVRCQARLTILCLQPPF